MKTKLDSLNGSATAPCSEVEYPCTDCGGDAFVGMSNWSGPKGKIIKKNERLCLRCARKRGVEWSFQSNKPKQ